MEEQKRPLASGQESVGKASAVAARWMDWGSLSPSETGAVATDTFGTFGTLAEEPLET